MHSLSTQTDLKMKTWIAAIWADLGMHLPNATTIRCGKETIGSGSLDISTCEYKRLASNELRSKKRKTTYSNYWSAVSEVDHQKTFFEGTNLPISLKTKRRCGGIGETNLPFARLTHALKTKPQPIVVPSVTRMPGWADFSPNEMGGWTIVGLLVGISFLTADRREHTTPPPSSEARGGLNRNWPPKCSKLVSNISASRWRPSVHCQN